MNVKRAAEEQAVTKMAKTMSFRCNNQGETRLPPWVLLRPWQRPSFSPPESEISLLHSMPGAMDFSTDSRLAKRARLLSHVRSVTGIPDCFFWARDDAWLAWLHKTSPPSQTSELTVPWLRSRRSLP